MVVVSPSKTKAWLAGVRVPGFGHHARRRDDHHLGILAFEAARTMSRLVSLHRALSDPELARLRLTLRSTGVAHLNSAHPPALLRLACAEMVDALDAAAASVARLAGRCRRGNPGPHGPFDHVYAALRAGAGDDDVARLRLGDHPRDAEKKVRKMERYVATTSALYVAMEALAELEAGPVRRKQGSYPAPETFDALRKRVTQQRDRVRRLREESLWCRRSDKVAELMSRFVVSVFARLCSVYGPFVGVDLPAVEVGRHGRVEFVPRSHSRVCPQQQHHHHHAGVYSSGPLERPGTVQGKMFVRNSGRLLRPPPMEAAPGDGKKEMAGLEPLANTLGSSGLALRYAEVVALVDSLARSPELVGKEAREELYWMLPAGLRAAVAGKLRGHRRVEGGAMAGGWRETVEGILEWLAPMAHDTVRWHSERRFEQRELDAAAAPRVLALQTLVFSDKVKAEVAIVELLVAFSCVCRHRRGGAEDEG